MGLTTLTQKHTSPTKPRFTTPPQNFVATTTHISTKRELIMFLHQCLFCPPKRTLLQAIKNNQLNSWPGITYEAVKNISQKHVPQLIKEICATSIREPNLPKTSFMRNLKRSRVSFISTRHSCSTRRDCFNFEFAPFKSCDGVFNTDSFVIGDQRHAEEGTIH